MSGVRILHQSNKRPYPKPAGYRSITLRIPQSFYDCVIALSCQQFERTIDTLTSDELEQTFHSLLKGTIIFESRRNLGLKFVRGTFVKINDAPEQNPECQSSESAEDKSAYNNCLWSVE